MMIDCDSCTVRGAACTDCVVTFLTIPVRAADLGRTGRAGDPRGPSTLSARGTASDKPVPGPAGAGRVDRVDLDDGERAAIDVLASSGLVPPLRMVRAM